MRLLTTFLFTAGCSGIAVAHELPGDENSLQQLVHQVLSLHHLPALLLLLVVGLHLVKRRISTTQQRGKS